MKAKRPARGTASKKKAQTRRGRESAREARRMVDAPPRRRTPTRDGRPQRSAPQTSPTPRPVDHPARPKSASQAKARAKARKAKAPKVVRPPLRERILVRLASVELNPRTLVARVPFVVLIIAALGLGLGVTLWLSTDAAERSYQLGHARQLNEALMQQKEALERDVLEAQAAPALAEAARNLGMIPSRDTAHLVQDPSGNWVVVGTPKPAEGIPPPPLNAPLADPVPPPPPAPRVVEPREVPVRVAPLTGPLTAPGPLAGPAAPGAPPVPLGVAPGVEVPHAAPGQLPAPGPAPLPPPQEPAAGVLPPADQLAAPPVGADPSHLAPGVV
ncbi:hypothetical protein, partial [Mycolicibacterium pyrenivorans]|uniref:hypothetical protein n=1 Tax=Mycolicibacterium pyrenivorans TaxID=187102 RepID=UPI0021F2FABA